MKKPTLTLPDREISCLGISIETTSSKILDSQYDVEVTAFGVIVHMEGASVFFPHAAVYRVSAHWPNRKRGRPKKTAEQHVETFELKKTRKGNS